MRSTYSLPKRTPRPPPITTASMSSRLIADAMPARRPAAEPRLAVEDEAASDAGAPEHAEQRPVRLAGAEREFGVGRDLHVVADPDARPDEVAELARERERRLPVGQVARLRDRPAVRV